MDVITVAKMFRMVPAYRSVFVKIDAKDYELIELLNGYFMKKTAGLRKDGMARHTINLFDVFILVPAREVTVQELSVYVRELLQGAA